MRSLFVPAVSLAALFAVSARAAPAALQTASAGPATTQTVRTGPALVRTDDGPVRGVEEGPVLAFKGIPFAAPPSGDLRWQPPRRPQAWKASLEAARYRSRCPQNRDLGGFSSAGGDEDCLHLNVFVPQAAAAAAAGGRLPVFVWIYGGAGVVGSAEDYDPVPMAVEGGAIVVTFNYRVGILGYFAHPDLAGKREPTGNYAYMDQQFALKWIQRNIAKFGGDPGRVTIAGESSGGASVLAHYAAPASAGTFQRGIAMSGTGLALKRPRLGSTATLESALETGARFAQAVGCETGGIRCLRSLPVSKLLAEQRPFMIPRPIIDGRFFPQDVAEAFRIGAFNRVPLINGATRDEARFFLAMGEANGTAPMTRAGYTRAIADYFGGELAATVEREYRVDDFETPSEAYAAAVTDAYFACTALAVNRWAGRWVPVRTYQFADRTAPGYMDHTSFPLGAAHTFELPYLFPGFGRGTGVARTLNPLQEELSRQMMRLWASDGGDASWPVYDPAKDNALRLSLPEAAVAEGAFRRAHRCDFWDATGIY